MQPSAATLVAWLLAATAAARKSKPTMSIRDKWARALKGLSKGTVRLSQDQVPAEACSSNSLAAAQWHGGAAGDTQLVFLDAECGRGGAARNGGIRCRHQGEAACLSCSARGLD